MHAVFLFESAVNQITALNAFCSCMETSSFKLSPLKFHAILNNYRMRSSSIWGIIKAEITQTEVLIIPHILREPNSIIVLLFIYIYIGLRVNAYIVNKNTQATKPFVFSRIWHKQHKLVWRHKVNIRPNYVIMSYMCFQYSMVMS